MKILAIDYGRKKCGIAITDKENKVVIPYGIIKTSEIFEKLKEIINQKDIKKIVIGLPLSLSGKEVQITKDVYNFKEKIEKEFHLEVILFDERMTSKIFKEKNSDDLSAMVILENYLKFSKIQKSS
jgi:putative Holliday junction resolvase